MLMKALWLTVPNTKLTNNTWNTNTFHDGNLFQTMHFWGAHISSTNKKHGNSKHYKCIPTINFMEMNVMVSILDQTLRLKHKHIC